MFEKIKNYFVDLYYKVRGWVVEKINAFLEKIYYAPKRKVEAFIAALVGAFKDFFAKLAEIL